MTKYRVCKHKRYSWYKIQIWQDKVKEYWFLTLFGYCGREEADRGIKKIEEGPEDDWECNE